MLLQHNPIQSTRFFYDAARKLFQAEISDLGRDAFRRLYDDAADVGLVIQGAKTRKVASFFISKEDRDREGDVAGWWLEPTPETLRKLPSLKGTKVLVVND